jgi:hypothetical protein
MAKFLGKQHESKRILLKIFVKKVVINYKKGEIESPIWFWLIDETLVLTSMLSVWIR